MSQGLGEVQIQVLRGFAKYHRIRESQGRQPGWIDLKSLKWYSWGEVRKSRDGSYKDKNHSTFKRALMVLVRRDFVEVSTFVGTDGLPVLEPRRVTPTLEYRLTEKGKCAVAQLHT